MKKIHKGAEADLYLENNKLIKERVKKAYRHPEIDVFLRKTRTKREAKIMRKLLSLGIPVPKVIKEDLKNFRIEMEYISGITLKEYLWNKKSSTDEKEKIIKSFYTLGFYIAEMHNSDVIHGDLTTSNILLRDSKLDELYIIDFGLSFVSRRVEDKATDLLVFKKSMMAAHPKIFNEIWESFLKGYSSKSKNFNEINSRLFEIEKRGRYL